MARSEACCRVFRRSVENLLKMIPKRSIDRGAVLGLSVAASWIELFFYVVVFFGAGSFFVSLAVAFFFSLPKRRLASGSK